ncbi:MAG: hypothetical protein AAB432_01765 [Patescibacteria group bacterium]
MINRNTYLLFFIAGVFIFTGNVSAQFIGPCANPPGPPNCATIQASSSGALQIATTTVYSTQSQLIFKTLGGSNQHIIFLPNGNIGIASTTPGAKLSVTGNVQIDAGYGFVGNGANITALQPAALSGGAFSSANYAFPLSLAVGTSTTTNLPATLFVNGTLQVTGASKFNSGIIIPAGATSTLAANLKVSYGDWGSSNQTGGNTTNQWIMVAQFTLDGSYKAFRMTAEGGGRMSGGSNEGNPFMFYVQARNSTTDIESANILLNQLTPANRSVKDVRLIRRSGSGVTNNVMEVWIQFGTSWQDTFPVTVKWWGTGTLDFLANTPQPQLISITSGYVSEYTINQYPFIQGRFGIADAPFIPTGILQVKNGSTEIFYASSSGDIGIGTTAPAQKLEVVGNIKITGTGNGVIFPDNTVQLTAGTSGGGGIASTSPFSVGYIPFATSSSAITNSAIFQLGSNIGIGTLSPQSLLDVNGTTTIRSGGSLVLKSTSQSGFIRATENETLVPSGGSTFGMSYGNSTNGHMFLDVKNNDANDSIIWRYSAANNGIVDTIGAVFNSTGKVGIGTTTPANKFTVFDSNDAMFSLNRSGAANPVVFKEGTDSAFVLNVAGGDRLAINSSGNIGIGTTNPGQKFEVVGNVSSTALCLGGTCNSAWPAGGTTNPGGVNNQIQYNNGGSFAGDANFTWSSSTKTLAIIGSTTISNNLIGGTKANNSSAEFKVYGQAYGGFFGLGFYTANTAGTAYTRRAGFDSYDSASFRLTSTTLQIDSDVAGNNSVVILSPSGPSQFKNQVAIGDLSIDPNYKLTIDSDSFFGPTYGIKVSASSSQPAAYITNGGSGAGLIVDSGNVGIGKTNPSQKLEVVGNVSSTAVCLSGTCNSTWPSGINYWTLSGGVLSPTSTSYNVTLGDGLGGTDLTIGGGAGKINAGTIDPVYTINGARYATYSPESVGIKVQVTGVANLKNGKAVISFASAAEGSDLWLFARTTNLQKEGLNNVIVLLTPTFSGNVWYQKNESVKTITIYGSANGEVSYQFIAPRFDAAKWTNFSSDNIEGFNLDKLLK